MNAATAYARLTAMRLPVIRTSEAAAVLGLSNVTAAQTLRRLSQAGLIQPLRHGLVWLSRDPIDPWVVLDYVAAPYPAYASLYSALYLRGVLSQLPAVFYSVTLGRSQRIATAAGTYSLHRIAPSLFDGFEVLASGVKLATLEKGLFDLAYLAATRSRLFARPPELELPKRLDTARLSAWIRAIEAPRRRTQVERQLELLIARA